MTLHTMDFRGQRAWVTGAAQGIGRQVALQLHARGAEVIGLDCQFTAEPCGFRCEHLDIAQPAAVAQLCQRLLTEGMAPDVLINAAGILRLGNSDELSLEDWQACLDVNVSGVFYLLRELVPHFKRQGRGAIVSIASNAAHVPRLQMAAYCASKAALVSLSHCVGLELAAYGVRCNVVSPGSTATPMLQAMLADAAAVERTIAGLPAQFKLGIPLGKIASPGEVANAVLFLASAQASHITLQDLVIDGGATLAA